MTRTAAQHYADMVRAYDAQRATIRLRAAEDRWSATAQRFRQDPRRPMDEGLTAVATYVGPDDVLLDVGGGAGRLGLPLALHCREVINLEPAAGMCAEFGASARQAGISNARVVQADWMSAKGIEGDVSLVANVTYFVADIVPFVEKLTAASRKRVIIQISSIPPPNQNARLFKTLHGRDQALVPGHTELLPVLWEIGLLPDVRVLPTAVARSTLGGPFAGRDEAIAASIAADTIFDEAGRQQARDRLAAAFDELFESSGTGVRLRLHPEPRLMLITWATR